MYLWFRWDAEEEEELLGYAIKLFLTFSSPYISLYTGRRLIISGRNSRPRIRLLGSWFILLQPRRPAHVLLCW